MRTCCVPQAFTACATSSGKRKVFDALCIAFKKPSERHNLRRNTNPCVARLRLVKCKQHQRLERKKCRVLP
jgi:hypothetical protein